MNRQHNKKVKLRLTETKFRYMPCPVMSSSYNLENNDYQSNDDKVTRDNSVSINESKVRASVMFNQSQINIEDEDKSHQRNNTGCSNVIGTERTFRENMQAD